MSSVIQRMVARATGQLSGAEPLLASRFQTSHTADAEILPERTAAPQDLQATREPAATHTSSRIARISPWSVPQPPAERPATTPPLDLQRMLAQLPQRPSSQAAGAVPLRMKAEQPTFGIGRPEQPAPSHGSTQPTVAAPQATTFSMVNANREKEPPAEAVFPPVAREHVAVSAVEGRNEKQAARTEPACANAAPEIHITIGKVELIAAKTETRPQPAVFRPRVSLDDYLKRRQGESL